MTQTFTNPGTGIYWDPAIYQREMERVFGSAWLFVGHETMVPNSGDFVSNYMGNDPVILVRDRADALRVFLNRCRHRGNKVCLYDNGSAAKSFRCSYHGWAYGLSGELAAVPFLDKYYDADFPRDELGLVAAPRVATYHGLVFASWSATGPSLEAFLGDDLRWYLDTLAFDDPGGIEVLPGRHRYIVPCNWKMLSENFGGDMYHFPITHASVIMVGRHGKSGSAVAMNNTDEYYSLKLAGADGIPHGLLQLAFGEATHENDRRKAAALSPAAVEWVEERHARRLRLLASRDAKPTGFHTGTIWPNLSLNGFGTAFSARTLLQWQPRGPEETDVWQWAFVERSAPPEVKEAMAFTLTVGQAAAGMVAPDDVDNFLRMRDVLHTARAGKLAFNYDLGGKEKDSLIPALPGCVMEQMSERYHRSFYRYWMGLMEYSP